MLVNEIQKIVDSIVINGQTEQITSMFADDFYANLKASKLTESHFPIMVYDPNIETTETFTQSGSINTIAPLRFAFFDLEDSLDSTAIQSDIIIQRMRVIAKQFVLRLQNSIIITPGLNIDSFKLLNRFKQFDCCASGVTLTIDQMPISEDISYCI